jgi:hypothetical protein
MPRHRFGLHRKFLSLTCAILVSLVMWLGWQGHAFADDVTPCAVGVAGEGPFAPGDASKKLESAWNAGDAQTLSLFAGDAHALSAWGQYWVGTSELSSFLHTFFYEESRPLQTLAQCEDGHTVIWTFRYPSGVNAAMICTVDNGQVVKLYWQFLPRDFDVVQPGPAGSQPVRQEPASAAVEAGAIVLVGSVLMYLLLVADRPNPRIHRSGKLLSALRAGIETSTQP